MSPRNLVLSLAVVLSAVAIMHSVSSSGTGQVFAATLGESTPAEKALKRARAVIAKTPESPRGWNALALAMARRARETADPAWYERAEEALAKAFECAPGDYEARRLRVWLRLGQHRFAEALKLAKKIQKEAPDDLLVYGFVVDANMELGNYSEALEAAQWMLDMRPGNVAGLTRGAYLREIHGDVEGALEFMSQAFQQTRASEAEDRAWILVQIAHLERGRGRIAAAARSVDKALALFPGYHYALAERARVHEARGEFAEAVAAWQARYETAPHPENLADVARALDRAGHHDKARPLWKRFEAAALEESGNRDNCNLDLVEYWIEIAKQPERALELARKEFAGRQDIRTRSVLAWALMAAGQPKEAEREMKQALATGLREAQLLYRAGVIAAAVGNHRAAKRQFEASLALHPSSVVADRVRELLGGEAR